MKTALKHQFSEFIEYIEFPAVIYVYESGRIIARNRQAAELLGTKTGNMNMAWENRKKRRFSKSLLGGGSALFFGMTIENGRQKIKVDMEITSFDLDYSHVLVCFFDQSYRKPFDRYFKSRRPRLYLKDKRNNLTSFNRAFKEAPEIRYLAGKEKEGKWREFFDGIRMEELTVMKEKRSRFNLEQLFYEEEGAPVFAKVSRIPIINKNGTCLGILGAYMLIPTKEEDQELLGTVLRENYILNYAAKEAGCFAFCFYQEEGWPVEFICPSFGGPSGHSRYWKEAILPEDYPRIFQEYKSSEQKEGLILNYRMLTAEGKVCWVEDRTFYTGYEGGREFRMGILTPAGKPEM